MSNAARPHRPKLVLIDCERERRKLGAGRQPWRPARHKRDDVDVDDLSNIQWPRLML